MSDTIIILHGKTLEAMSQEAGSYELLRSLKDLATNNTKNYAVYDDPHATPQGDVKILPKPAVPPAGGTLICDGVLTVAGVPIAVEAFRV